MQFVRVMNRIRHNIGYDYDALVADCQQQSAAGACWQIRVYLVYARHVPDINQGKPWRQAGSVWVDVSPNGAVPSAKN